MNTMDTFGDAFNAIEAGLRTPVLVTSKRDDILRPLLQTVKDVAGLDENEKPDETVLKSQLPLNIKQLVADRLREAGVLN